MARHIAEGIELTAGTSLKVASDGTFQIGSGNSLTWNAVDSRFVFSKAIKVTGNALVTGNLTVDGTISGNLTDVDFDALNINNGGDISFYSDAGITLKALIDSATGNLKTGGSITLDGPAGTKTLSWSTDHFAFSDDLTVLGDLISTTLTTSGLVKITQAGDLEIYDGVPTLKCSIDGGTGKIDTVGDIEADGDVKVTASAKGLVLYDGTNYWRVTIDTSGNLVTALVV